MPLVVDTLSVGLFDPASLQEFFGVEGLQPDAAPGVLCCGTGRCNNCDPDRSGGKSRISFYTRTSGKPFDAGHLQQLVSCSPEGETGQKLPKMSA